MYAEYKHRSFGDIAIAAKSLPRMSKRAEVWIRSFETRHGHQILCLGDMKDILSRALTHGQFTDVMIRCDPMWVTDVNSRWAGVNLWDCLRDMFPTMRDMSRVSDYTFGPDSDFGDWIDNMKQKWLEELGKRHKHSEATENMFYGRASRNLPE